jgi:riboflavin synthase
VFTGLVQTIGQIVELQRRTGSSRMGVRSSLPPDELTAGESIAVDGACLTLVRRRGDRFYADAVAETLKVTTLERLRIGDRVNLERSLCLGDRLGGHLMQGHVDGTAAVRQVQRHGDDWRVRVDLGPDLRRYVARKGSVALQGVSLTVAAVGTDWFEVVLIPETSSRTTLGRVNPGDRLNLEVDLLARYLERLYAEQKQNPQPTE